MLSKMGNRFRFLHLSIRLRIKLMLGFVAKEGFTTAIDKLKALSDEIGAIRLPLFESNGV